MDMLQPYGLGVLIGKMKKKKKKKIWLWGVVA